MKSGDRVRITTTDSEFEGALMPEYGEVVILKLDSGYNIGIARKSIVSQKFVKAYRTKKVVEKKIKQSKELPRITVLHTGGTIASKVDYETGGVIARFSPDELISMFPELRSIAAIDSRLLSNMWSEDIRFAHYNRMMREIAKEVARGVQGIIITHGTDTLHYTAAALAFGLENVPIPVVLVGAQRSSDRPSSDAGTNLIGAALFITQAKIPGVCIAMHADMDDDSVVILPPCNTRKMHASRRDAFTSITGAPIARVNVETCHVDILSHRYSSSVLHQGLSSVTTQHASEQPLFTIKPFNEKIRVGILKAHPHMFAHSFQAFKGYDGLIIEGTGLGHFPLNEIDEHTKEHTKIVRAVKDLCKNTIVAVTTQTIHGRIHLDVYSTGRKIQEEGILGNHVDMITETAFVKLAWLLSNYDRIEVRRLYGQNLRGELLDRDTAW